MEHLVLHSQYSARFIHTLHHIQGNYDEAGQLFERSLAIREKVLGPDHPDVPQSLNNRAGL